MQPAAAVTTSRTVTDVLEYSKQARDPRSRWLDGTLRTCLDTSKIFWEQGPYHGGLVIDPFGGPRQPRRFALVPRRNCCPGYNAKQAAPATPTRPYAQARRANDVKKPPPSRRPCAATPPIPPRPRWTDNKDTSLKFMG